MNITRHWKIRVAIVVALVLCAAPAIVLACIPTAVDGMMSAGVVDATQELPGGG